MISRLFRIVYILISEKNTTATILANRLETSTRTIYRDLDRLTEAGVPIYTERGANGGIYLLDDYVFNKSIISEEQKKSLLSSLDLLSQIDYSSESDSINALTDLLGKKESWIEVDFTTWSLAEGDNKDIFIDLKNAILDKHIVSIDYISSNGSNHERRIKPVKLYFKNSAWYLYAYCMYKEDFRFFKLSRIISYKILNESFESIDSNIPMTIYKGNDEYIDVVLEFDKSCASRVYDDFRDVEVKDSKLIVTHKINDIPWLIGYILTYGSYAKIIKPLEIKDLLLEEVNKIIDNYKGE